MSSELPGIREMTPHKPIYINNAADLAKGLNITEKGAALVREVVGLLATDRAVRVTTSFINRNAELGKPIGATGIPQLDNPSDEVAKQVDLEKLMSYIQLAFDEKQAKMAQDRINSKKDTLEARFKDQMKQLKDSFKKMDKAAKAGLFTKIFGWAMAAVACVAAVAASVVTGGLAAGPIIGAVIAIAGCVLNETGATEKITEGIAKGLEKLGMKKDVAKVVAQVAFAVGLMAASLCAGNVTAVIKIADVTAKVAQIASKAAQIANVAMMGGALATTVAGGVSTGLNYTAQMSRAKLSEAEKYLAIMRQAMEESQEELENILEKIQNVFSDIVSILESKTNTLDTIAMNMGQRA